MALKLTDSDKKTIVELYQHPEESTATLASRYAVSSSTISRILKQELSPTEYQTIVQQKKGGGSKPQSRKTSSTSEASQVSTPSSSKSAKSSTPAKPKLKTTVVSDNDASDGSTSTPPKSSKRDQTRQRPSAKTKTTPVLSNANRPPQKTDSDFQAIAESGVEDGLERDAVDVALDSDGATAESVTPSRPHDPDELVNEIQADLLDEEFEEDDDVLDDEFEDEDDIDDEADLDNDSIESPLEPALDGSLLSILPFSEAQLPRTCYIIIDRSAELITRPLKTFADLGMVPEDEVNEPTLPIFDNHRVAKRFANRRTQRIVKVPDARVLKKTSPYLMDKGITRLLLDGQVYALLDEDELD